MDRKDDHKRKLPLPKAFRAPLAYENPAFFNGPDGRALRVLAEYWEPLARFRKERVQDTVVFFGSARFNSLDIAQKTLEVLEKPGSVQPAPPEEQPDSRIVSELEELESIGGVDERGELSWRPRTVVPTKPAARLSGSTSVYRSSKCQIPTSRRH
jgi:hypothetical protein